VTSAKNLLKVMVDAPTQVSPSRLAEDLSIMALNTNDTAVDDLCSRAIAALPEEADAVRNGNLKVLNKLVGHVMKASRGRADALAIQERLRAIICRD